MNLSQRLLGVEAPPFGVPGVDLIAMGRDVAACAFIHALAVGLTPGAVVRQLLVGVLGAPTFGALLHGRRICLIPRCLVSQATTPELGIARPLGPVPGTDALLAVLGAPPLSHVVGLGCRGQIALARGAPFHAWRGLVQLAHGPQLFAVALLLPVSAAQPEGEDGAAAVRERARGGHAQRPLAAAGGERLSAQCLLVVRSAQSASLRLRYLVAVRHAALRPANAGAARLADGSDAVLARRRPEEELRLLAG